MEVVAALFLNGIEDRQTTVWSLEGNDVAVDFHFRLSVDSNADFFKHFLGERHHPVVVLVAHIELHAGELRIVCLVHAFVAEVLTDFIHAFESTHDESLEVELGGNAHIHVGVECIEMRDEWSSRCTTWYHLEHRCLHFGVACFVEDAAHGASDNGTLLECFLHALVDHQVHVALAIAKLRVIE